MGDIWTDAQLRQAVLDELEFEPSVNAAHIGVAANEGVVTLSGHVTSYNEKIAAEEAARRVKGARAVASEIEVRFPLENKTGDEEIARRGLDILRWSALVPRDSVKLTVHDGWVRLTGEVDSHFQRKAAEDHIRRLSGVSGVINNVAIRSVVQPVDVRKRIENALRRSAEVEAREIHVGVLDGGTIALEGTVQNWKEREAVENAAWSAPGVRSVQNKLAIG